MIEIQMGYELAISMLATIAPLAILFAISERIIMLFVTMLKGRVDIQ